MENIEKNVVLLLNGKDAEESQDFCDFTLEDQNEAASIQFYIHINKIVFLCDLIVIVKFQKV